MLLSNAWMKIFPLQTAQRTVIHTITSLKFLTRLGAYALKSLDSDDINLTKLILLYLIANGKNRGFYELQFYEELLVKMDHQKDVHTAANLKQQMLGPNRDLYLDILQYLEEYLAQTGCEVAVVSMIEARDKVIRRVILTQWKEIFPITFKTEMDLSHLWYVYNFMEDLIQHNQWLCWNNRGVFQYMHEIIEQKHNVSTDEKDECAKLLFNIKSMCRQTGCISFSDDDGD